MAFDVGRAAREAQRRRPPGGYPKMPAVMPSVRDMSSARDMLLELVNEKRRMLGWTGGINPFDVGEAPAWKRVVQAYQRNLLFPTDHYSPFGVLDHALGEVNKAFRPFGGSGLSRPVSKSFTAMNLVADSASHWHVRQARASRAATFQAVMRATSAFGPVVVTPGYEDDASFSYHPGLQGWLIPETASDPEDLWDELIAIVQGIARLHYAEVLLSRLGGGARYMVRVAQRPAGAIIVGTSAGGIIDHAVGHPIGSVAGGVIGSLITYYLTRH